MITPSASTSAATARAAPGGRGFVRPKELPISTGLSLFAVIFLVLANGFFVATEFSLVSVRRTRMQQLASEGSRSARAVLDRLDHLDTYIAATQLGITISSIGLGWIGKPALAHLIEPMIDQIPFISEGTRDAARDTIAFAIAFSIVTALHIVFGELAPKSIALQRSEATSLVVAAPIYWFNLIFRPVISVLNGVGNWVVRQFGVQPAAGHALVQSAAELRLSIDASRQAGLVEQAAHDLVNRAFTFTELEVRHAMVPRTEMVAVPIDASLDDVLGVAADSSHMRLPVYENNTDHIVGIVFVKRLLPLLRESHEAGESAFHLRDYVTEAIVVPETVPAADVLNRLRLAGTQIAVVIDEYGGTAGVVTLEDLVERLVGEIDDESRMVGEAERHAVADVDLIDGLMGIGEARERFALELSEDHYNVETVGGYVFSALARRPELGDEVSLPGGRVLRVEELDGLRIARLRVLTKPTPPPSTPPGGEDSRIGLATDQKPLPQAD
ncbi:MAG: hemolysin family protein [Thermomicrobiales bacterium]